MKNYKNGDSLVGIIIGIFILSIALLGIINVLGFNQNTLSIYNQSINKYIISSNVENVIKKLNNDKIIIDSNDFYLYKDTVNKEFKYLTGTANEGSQYVDKLLNISNPTDNLSRTYKVELEKKIDILRHVVYPPEIANIVFHYDAENIDGTFNSSLSDGDKISTWKDLSGNNIDAESNSAGENPTYIESAITGKPGVQFLGTSATNGSILLPNDGNSHSLLNKDNSCSNQYTFNQKSFAIVFKTGFDITRDQFIYEQGGQATGYSFSIHDGKLRAGILNKAYINGHGPINYSCFDDASQERDNNGSGDHRFKSVKFDNITPDTYYFITIVQDSIHESSPGVEDDDNNTLRIYLNGELVSSTDHVDPQPEHHIPGLGGVNERSVRPWDKTTVKAGDGDDGCNDQCLFFDGYIGEFVSWNHALSANEIRGVQNYFKEKWLGATSNIKYHRIQSEVKKVN